MSKQMTPAWDSGVPWCRKHCDYFFIDTANDGKTMGYCSLPEWPTAVNDAVDVVCLPTIRKMKFVDSP